MFHRPNNDKKVEQLRYEKRALSHHLDTTHHRVISGSQSIPLVLRHPYEIYEKRLREIITPSQQVLELCAGMGEHSSVLFSLTSRVLFTDISPNSLDVLRRRFPPSSNIQTRVCDIENLPFPPESFDTIACAGGLSYGDNNLVLNEILRVLKPGGHFVCVDSLNHNPVYKFNRLVHYVRGRRSISTLNRMPTLELINHYRASFSKVSCSYFGSFSWLLSPLSPFIGERCASKISTYLDQVLKSNSLAFKFVLVAKKS